ncbi:MAG: MarR family transcriptional regulator [Acidobacteriota bacterium]|nr:MarR family transcriptional regulator [Acidobacteriota bacterium]
MSEDRREAFYHERIRQCGPQYAGFDLLSAETALNLLYTYDVFHQVTGRYMADFGLAKSAFNILMLLRHAQPEGMLLHDLGELLLVSRANITGLIDHLEEKGYVKRVVDVHDRRARFARLTKEGAELLDSFAPVHYKRMTELLKDLTNEEKRSLVLLLKKTRGSLMAHSGVSAA